MIRVAALSAGKGGNAITGTPAMTVSAYVSAFAVRTAEPSGIRSCGVWAGQKIRVSKIRIRLSNVRGLIHLP